jgi:hypothetical protein
MSEFVRDHLRQVIPAHWFPSSHPPGSVLLSVYAPLMAHRATFDNSRLNLDDAVIAWHWGTVRCLGGDIRIDVRTNAEGSAEFFNHGGAVLETRVDGWLVILQRMAAGSSTTPIEDLQRRRTEILALLTSVIGIGTVFHLELENEIPLDLSGFGYSASWGSIARDLFITPLPTQERKRLARSLEDSINGLPDAEQRRIRLAQHWFDRGTRSQSTDAFINLWVALEALVLEGSANIGALKRAVGRAYGLGAEEANRRFGLGRIYGYRCDLFHGQRRIQPDSLLLGYMAALWIDVFFERLGVPCERRAEQAMPTRLFDQTQWLPDA